MSRFTYVPETTHCHVQHGGSKKAKSSASKLPPHERKMVAGTIVVWYL